MVHNVVINIATSALIVVGLLLAACAPFGRGRLAQALLPVGLFAAFTGLAVGVHINGWVTGLDAGVAGRFGTDHSYGWYVAALVIDWIGSPVATAVTGVTLAALLSWRARTVIPAIVVIGTVGAAALANTAVKAVVQRSGLTGVRQQFPNLTPTESHLLAILDRLPRLRPLPAELYGFPSGHVTGIAALLGIIAVYVGAGRRRAVRGWLAGSVVAAVVVVAVSRLYLHVHWLTDVVGGAVLAGAFVSLGAAVFGALRLRSGRLGSPQKAGELDTPR